ncbi:hypothetical protein GALMADRAFT_61822 [Galerina marginata CBS 339.88]|uniref:Uncharacterized protein n=1 Tax=Galerina marginata (strain CBS 339.88) TaxID=685588 RepID=A0A067TMB4_GALM3|nr:hypothetical protein GALMADRAFT_61822 [Galerina marginata CBS 339.88]
MHSSPTTQIPSPAPGFATTNQSQTTHAQNAKSPGAERPLADIISDQFPPFDAQTLVCQPFENEAVRDAKFEEELGGMLLKAILETHAWAAARPKHEAALETQKLEDQISQIMATEREQGMCSPAPSTSSSFFRLRIVEQTRERLGEFVRRMKTALAALTGTPF